MSDIEMFIQNDLHNFLHNGRPFQGVSELLHLHHHHITGLENTLFVLRDEQWIWHAHDDSDTPHDHEGFDFNIHDHLPEQFWPEILEIGGEL